MSQLRVLVVDHNLSDRTGGIARISQEQASALRGAGLLVTYLNLSDCIVETETNVSLEAFRIGTLGIMKPSLRNFWLIRRILRKQWDIIQVHNPFFIGLGALIYANYHRIPSFFTFHSAVSGLEIFALSNRAPSALIRIVRKIARLFLRLFSKLPTYVIALNEEIKIELTQIGIRNVTVMRNGRHLSQYVKERIPHKGIELLSVGSVTARKNQLFLLECMKYLPSDYHLTLIGEMIEPQYNDLIENYIKENPVNVTLTGAVPHEKITDYLARADVGVSASLVEGQSIATLEALSAGIPFVALKNTSSSELINEKIGRVLEKEATPRQFAAAIKSVVLDIRSGAVKAHEIQASVAHYNWKSVAAETRLLYEETIKAKNTQRHLKATLLAKGVSFFIYLLLFLLGPFLEIYSLLKKTSSK